MMTRMIFPTAIALALAGAAHAETLHWTANMDQSQETSVDTKAPDAVGAAEGTLDTENGKMTWTINWSGLTGDAIAMHFHGPAKKGDDSGVQVNIGKMSGLNSPVTGETTLKPEQVKQVENGMWYINVHTPANKSGEIRGQVETAE